MYKLFSARFWITIMVGLVFVSCSMNGILDKEQIISIITLVIGFYFGRVDRQTKGEANDNK